MATLISKATGNFTASSTWAPADTTSLLDSEVGTTALTTSAVASSAFVPGAITVDGVGVKVSSRGSNTGTITIELFNSTDNASVASVVTNVTNLPGGTLSATVPRSWVFFKFAANQTLIAGKSYVVRASVSSASSVSLYRDGTLANYSRFLRTTTAASAPAAADVIIVCGDQLAGSQTTRVVTMDNTTSATSFGKTTTSHLGTFQCGTTASTAYYYKLAGDFEIHHGGTVNLGTVGTPIPSTSSMTLHLACTSVLQFILQAYGGTFNAYGATKTVSTKLAADAAVAATSVTLLAAPTGWATGDTIAFGSTTRTASECESKAQSSLSSTTLGVAALTNAHSGTGVTAGEVANLTRNVVIRGDTAANTTYVNVANFCVLTWQYVEMTLCGGSANRCLVVATTTAGSFNVQFCSIHDCTVAGVTGVTFSSATNDNIVFSNNVVYGFVGTASSLLLGTFMANTAMTSAPASFTVSGNLFMLTTGALTIGVLLLDGRIVFTSNTIVGATNWGLLIGTQTGTPTLTTGTFDSVVVHACVNGIVLGADTQRGTFSNCKTWRNSQAGFATLGQAANISIDSLSSFGNTLGGMSIDNRLFNFAVTNSTFDGGATLVQAAAIRFETAASLYGVSFRACTFGVSGGNSTADISVVTGGGAVGVDALFENCTFSSTTLIAGQASMATGSLIKLQDCVGSIIHRTFSFAGEVRYSSTGGVTDAYSCMLLPRLSTTKLVGARAQFRLPAGTQPTVSVRVRRSKTSTGDAATYNGNLPRLILKLDAANGLATDTVLATATVASDGAYELLSAAISVVTSINTDAIVVVDCDGTAGWVSVDDWAVGP